VSAFSDALERVAARVPEAEAVMILGTDGIPIEKKVVRPDPSLEAVAAELTTLLRASGQAASDTGLGAMKELSLVTDRTTTLLVSITPDYFLFASLGRGAIVGRARFALRLAGLTLRPEFE
jgi:predicted regulator of Ras-like GTPase activity (Roadblock/LC7/MglB family)